MTMTKVLAAFLLALLLIIGVQQCQLTSREKELRSLRLAEKDSAVKVAQARVDTVRIIMAARVDTVRKTIAKVRVDTFEVAPQTAQDTAKAVGQLPTLVAAHDTLQRQCSALALSCEDYRKQAEARDTAQTKFIHALQQELAGAQPSRLSAMWNKVKMPLAFGVGLVLGAQAVK